MRLWVKYHRYCAYCGVRLTIKGGKTNTITHDHIIPKSKGGIGLENNKTSACKKCNRWKSDKIIAPSYDTKSGDKLKADNERANRLTMRPLPHAYRVN